LPYCNTSPCHMVLTGDFNTTEESEVFQSLRDVGLQSLWDYKPTKGASTNFTTWKFRPVDDGSIRDVKRVIDYIWFSTGLTAVRRWAPLSSETIGAKALPSPNYASDHIAVCCDLMEVGNDEEA